MKMTIAWHENCLKNYAASVERKRAEIERLTSDFQRTEKDFKFYERQISEAKAKKKDGFDSGKFLVKTP